MATPADALLPIQNWPLYRNADNEILLQGPDGLDASAFTFVFEIATAPSQAPYLSIVPTIDNTTNIITVPFTEAQMTSVVTAQSYASLWRTDSGSTKPLATGIIYPILVAHP